MKKSKIITAFFSSLLLMSGLTACSSGTEKSAQTEKTDVTANTLTSADYSVTSANPFLPHWEYIPDGEPYVFEDPDNAGKYRMYVYGSHDTIKTKYCGHDLVTWSAPVEDLTNWRYDGVIFEYFAEGNEIADVMFAPDVAVKFDENNKPTYYLYPNNQAWGRYSMVAKSDSPAGPFEPINLKEGSTTETVGCMGFDPAVLVDDDGRVYGYWGFQKSYCAELDPETMCTVKEGTEIIEDMIPVDGEWQFFEASSIRKIEDKYIFMWSRNPGAQTILSYAYSDNPLGPWTFGGTVIDSIDSGYCNNHGGIVEANGQWYSVYHRQSSDGFSRQAMAAPIGVEVIDGKVVITQGEHTSQGFHINGLDPYKKYSAGITCHISGGVKASAEYDVEKNTNPLVNTINGSFCGYKYFNFESGENKLILDMIPQGVDGTIFVFNDEKMGIDDKIGMLEITADMPKELASYEIALEKELGQKEEIYLAFRSFTPDTEIAKIHYMRFAK